MKTALIAICVTLISALASYAQSEQKPKDPPPSAAKTTGAGSEQSSSPQQELLQALPDTPIPVLPSLQDGPFPCPSGNGRSCALLGGRVYFSDPIRMTQHDATWGKAMRNPGMLVADALNLASTIADIEGTQACMRAQACKETNPIFGSNPSRARAYGIAVPVALASYALLGRMKRDGQGNFAFALLWGATMAHTYFAAGGFAAANKGPSTNPNSAQHVQLQLALRF
jgi:hypothetical protein